MFAILFIAFLMGQSGYCFIPNQLDVYGINQVKCESEGHLWLQKDINFNNIINSMISLFILSTLEGWPAILQQNIDIGPAWDGPIKDSAPLVTYLFVVFIIIGSFFCVNLFVAIVSMNFNKAQEKNKNLYLNKDQEQWILIVSL